MRRVARPHSKVGFYAVRKMREKGDIQPPPPLIDFGVVPSLSTGPSGKTALSNFKTSALLQSFERTKVEVSLLT
jgi:hypothetical protein